MCNAHNHHPNCTCGWGGFGHAGRRSSVSELAAYSFQPTFRTYDSFVIPNARCPKCGAYVFFYQSPHGGRVFFDALGPPWPKHPCTDPGKPIALTRYNTDLKAFAAKTYRWTSENWEPFVIEYIEGIDRDIQKVVGTTRTQRLILYSYRKIDPASSKPVVSAHTVAHVRVSGPGRYLLSFIGINAKPDSLVCYGNRMDASIATQRRVSVRKRKK